jgi:hypothetical protein
MVERIDPRTFNLAKKQLAYLREGETGTRTEQDMDGEVQKTAKSLDNRLRYLFEDISLFHAHGYLNEQAWPDDGKILADMDRNDPLYDPPSIAYGISHRDNYELAISFGHACRLLYQNTESKLTNDQIALGFLIGLTGGWLSDGPADDTNLQKLSNTIPESDLQLDAFQMPDQETLDNLQEIISEIKESVQSETGARKLDREIRYQLEESELSLTDTLQTYVSNKVKSGEVDVISHEKTAKKYINKIESQDDIYQAEAVAEEVYDDLKALEQNKYRRGSAINVFWAVYNRDIQTTDQTASYVDTHKHQVNTLTNRLSGGEHPWSDRPLINKTGNKIKITEYGSVVGYLLNAENGWRLPTKKELTDACHAYVLDQYGQKRRRKKNG